MVIGVEGLVSVRKEEIETFSLLGSDTASLIVAVLA
jgi:hypothetical protein